MRQRLIVPHFLVLASASLLCAQTPSLSLCIVQTKSDQAAQYEPSAGPWAVATYNHLAEKKLRDGSRLAITVLPASVKRDILPEVRRLQCAWVLELSDLSTVSAGGIAPQSPTTGDLARESVFFTLWNRETKKAIAQGAPLYGSTWRRQIPLSETTDPAAASIAQQVLASLNKLH